MQTKRIEIFHRLLQDTYFRDFCIDNTKFPEAFAEKPENIKAIVLGADPTNPQGNFFEYVFGLENPNSPYFRSILMNLATIDLNLGNIYVQNLCPNYFTNETDKNIAYESIASKYWLAYLKEDLDLRFNSHVPVLITAWKPLLVVAPDAEKFKDKKIAIYSQAVIFNQNFLGRPVFAFFRGGRRLGFNGFYDLKFPGFSEYKAQIKRCIFE